MIKNQVPSDSARMLKTLSFIAIVNEDVNKCEMEKKFVALNHYLLTTILNNENVY